MKWRSMKTSKPTKPGDYLVFSTVKHRIGIEYWREEGKWQGVNTQAITHWMPLPASPSNANGPHQH